MLHGKIVLRPLLPLPGDTLHAGYRFAVGRNQGAEPQLRPLLHLHVLTLKIEPCNNGASSTHGRSLVDALSGACRRIVGLVRQGWDKRVDVLSGGSRRIVGLVRQWWDKKDDVGTAQGRRKGGAGTALSEVKS